MTLKSVSEMILGGSGIIFILMTIIQIVPIKINPWSYLSRKIGKAINHDMIERMDKLDKNVENLSTDLQNLREECNERDATLSRVRILRFGDEILHGIPHSKEHYDNILQDITFYENYCRSHPNYINNIAVMTIKHIKNMYQKHLEQDDFL